MKTPRSARRVSTFGGVHYKLAKQTMAGQGKHEQFRTAQTAIGGPQAQPQGDQAEIRAASTAKRKPQRRSRSRNPLVRLARAIVGWVLRVLWAIGWRVTAVVAIVVGLAVAYTYTTLPEYKALMDGRARGSVTLLDREGRCLPGAATSSAVWSPPRRSARISKTR